MQKVVFAISISLDGYAAGAAISNKNPLGKDGERLHDWMFAYKTDADKAILSELVASSGAVIVGGRTYYTAIEDAWGAKSPFDMPAIVISHEIPKQQFPGFTYVTDGIESALDQAKKQAGDKDVWIMGGATTGRRYLQAGLLDEIQLHIAPVLLGNGTPLFSEMQAQQYQLEKYKVLETRGAVHLYFRVSYTV